MAELTHWGAGEILVALRRVHDPQTRDQLREGSGLGEEDFTEALAELVEAEAVLTRGDGESTVYGLRLEDAEADDALAPPGSPPPPPAPPGTGGPDQPGEPDEPPEEPRESIDEVARRAQARLREMYGTVASMVELKIPPSHPFALLAAEAARSPGAHLEVNARVRFIQGDGGDRTVTEVLEVYSVEVVRGG